jgi:hypothetical protein
MHRLRPTRKVKLIPTVLQYIKDLVQDGTHQPNGFTGQKQLHIDLIMLGRRASPADSSFTKLYLPCIRMSLVVDVYLQRSRYHGSLNSLIRELERWKSGKVSARVLNTTWHSATCTTAAQPPNASAHTIPASQPVRVE